MCDGRLVGIVWSLMTGQPQLFAKSMANILQVRAIRNEIEKHTELPTKPHYLEPIEVTARAALSEVSSADPTNIQQVAAGTLSLNNLYYQNVLTQAKSSYRAAVVTATIASALFLSAVVLAIFFSRLVPSTLSTIGGAIVAGISGLNFWLFGQTSKQLDSFHLRLERMQRYLVANSVSSAMTETARDEGLRSIVDSLCGKKRASTETLDPAVGNQER